MGTQPNCYGYQKRWPNLGNHVFIAAGARIIGDVTIGDYSSVWFNVVIRGDVERIIIGAESNIQDNCVLHVDYGEKGMLRVGNRVTVGHSAILHACTIEDEALIGMGAAVLNEAVVERRAMVAAGSVVTPRTRVPSGSLFAGVPAKRIRDLSPEELAHFADSAAHYVRYATEHAAG